MLQYNCVNGQSFSDVCMNTYGTMDYYIKLLTDNNVSPEDLPYSGQKMIWDNTLVADQSILTLISTNKIVYSTLLGFGIPEQQSPTMANYDQIQPQATYTASTDGETVVTLTPLQDGTIISVILEIKTLLRSQYTFDATVGTISLIGCSLDAGQTLFVTYSKPTTI